MYNKYKATALVLSLIKEKTRDNIMFSEDEIQAAVADKPWSTTVIVQRVKCFYENKLGQLIKSVESVAQNDNCYFMQALVDNQCVAASSALELYW